MSSTVTVTPAKGARGIGLVSIIAGIVLLLAGIGTWVVVANQLSAEEITVSDDSSFMAGRHVNGPLTAYAQAEVITSTRSRRAAARRTPSSTRTTRRGRRS